MKRLFYVVVLIFVGSLSLKGQEILEGKARVENATIVQVGERVFVSLDIVSDDWGLRSQDYLVLTPSIESLSGNEVVELPSIDVRGRQQYIFYERNLESEDNGQSVYRASEVSRIHYETSVPYEGWMSSSRLMLGEDLCGCTKTLLASSDYELQQYSEEPEKVYSPTFAYIIPKAEEVKTRYVEGEAYIIFLVDDTKIDPSIFENAEELNKIVQAVETVRNDSDVSITSMSIKGFASPEGTYDHNEYLAKNRTAVIADYVKSRLEGITYPVTTSYVIENWEGLREYVSSHSINNRAEILAIIDDVAFDGNDDAREQAIKSRYPETYEVLLSDCYPTLRRTDFRVEYVVRTYTTEEAKEIIFSQPQKLSLQEMYNVAQTYPVGSKEQSEVFEVAVRMFPNDPVANLNVANAALQRNDLVQAERYLAKAGNSGEAVLSRAILAALKGDYSSAERLFNEAQQMGIKEAETNMKQLL